VIRSAVVGYGGAFNMGKAHAEWMNATDGLQCVAVCDLDPTRTAAAQQDFPHVETYNDVGAMLKQADVDLVTIVTPHNTHAPLALKCLKAGKHAITEKPMCITVKEADAMLAAAKKAGVMVSTFHNRHWDGDFMAIKETIDRGVIGEVFHVEMYGGGYHHQGLWWRADKQISGGAFYDWGAHYLWWLLQIIPSKIDTVTGVFQQDIVWKDTTNEDDVQAFLRFKGGQSAHVHMSHISLSGKPRWRILGTKGAIVDEGGGSFKVRVMVSNIQTEGSVPYKKSDWHAYYRNVAAHLLRGEDLIIKPELARRVIAVMEFAERSAKSGKAEKVPYE
jgi:predicted dehydrogenase